MYQPFPIGERFLITPTGQPPSQDDRLPLFLDRGAFGSGEHETTASCLEILEQRPEVQGARLLDLGSGTGILAIGALMLGAAQAVCVDINPAAVATARKNFAANGLEGQAEHRIGSLSGVRETGFDLILANIYGDLLLDFATELTAKARPGALLLLSGILWEYNYEVRRAYEEQRCELLQNRMLEEFSTVLLRKK